MRFLSSSFVKDNLDNSAIFFTSCSEILFFLDINYFDNLDDNKDFIKKKAVGLSHISLNQ